MNLVVRKMSIDDVALLDEQWLTFARDKDELPTQAYEKAIDWAGRVMRGEVTTDAKVHSVAGQDGEIKAIFDLVDVRAPFPKGFIKILSVVVSPQLDFNAMKATDRFSMPHELSETVAQVIAYGLDRMNEFQSCERLKFYASDTVTLQLIQRAWGSESAQELLAETGIKTDLRGNWAEFSRYD